MRKLRLNRLSTIARQTQRCNRDSTSMSRTPGLVTHRTPPQVYLPLLLTRRVWGFGVFISSGKLSHRFSSLAAAQFDWQDTICRPRRGGVCGGLPRSLTEVTEETTTGGRAGFPADRHLSVEVTAHGEGRVQTGSTTHEFQFAPCLGQVPPKLRPFLRLAKTPCL